MKVMVIGYSGAGKSTLAKMLAEHYNIPLLYLDKVQFIEGWKDRDNKQAYKMVEDFLNDNKEWVIDGNYGKRLYFERAAQADQIIYLNFNRFLCLYRAIKRKNLYQNKSRESISAGCKEKIDYSFVKWILLDGRNKEHKDRINKIKTQYQNKFYEFKNPKQLQKHIDSIISVEAKQYV